MAGKKPDSVNLSGEELDRIEGLADTAERVSKRKGDGDKDTKKNRRDTAYGAALEPIMKQGFEGTEAGELASVVGESMKRKRGEVLYTHPRSKRKD